MASKTIKYKIVVLGKGGVGKSAFTVQFVQKTFLKQYDPTVEDSYQTQIDIGETHYILDILDTAGTEQFTAMRDLYMKTGHGFLLVYSITSKATFDALDELYHKIQIVKEHDAIPIVIVGNKCDLEDQRQVKLNEGDTLAKKYGSNASFMEASAKISKNVNEVFYELVKRMNTQRKDEDDEPLRRRRRFCLVF